jgi:hypothetical protein
MIGKSCELPHGVIVSMEISVLVLTWDAVITGFGTLALIAKFIRLVDSCVVGLAERLVSVKQVVSVDVLTNG